MCMFSSSAKENRYTWQNFCHLLSQTSSHFENRSSLKGKDLLLRSKLFLFNGDRLTRETKTFLAGLHSLQVYPFCFRDIRKLEGYVMVQKYSSSCLISKKNIFFFFSSLWLLNYVLLTDDNQTDVNDIDHRGLFTRVQPTTGLRVNKIWFLNFLPLPRFFSFPFSII